MDDPRGDAAVLFELAAPHVALVTINRPAARNAVNGAVAAGLEAALERVEADGEIWVAVNFEIRKALAAKYDAAFPESDATLQRRCAMGEVPGDPAGRAAHSAGVALGAGTSAGSAVRRDRPSQSTRVRIAT